jgi:tetratricopeptide (TPR) repeat protein
MLVPVIGLVQVGAQEMADRYTYLPLIGLFIIVVWAAQEVTEGIRIGTVPSIAAGGVVLAVLGGLTVYQLQFWRDSVTLFTHALGVTRDNAFAHNNLGSALAAKADKADALAHYAEAVRLDPGRVLFQFNLAAALAHAGQSDAAVEHYLAAIRTDPSYAKAYNGLGAVLVAQHQLPAAVTNFSEAVRLDPEYGDAYNNLGNALSLGGKPEEALASFSEALRLDPSNGTIYLDSGLALAKLGRMDEALARFADAVRLDSSSAEARYELGRGLFSKGEFQAAAAELTEAVQLRPEHAPSQLYLGLVCMELQSEEEGLKHLREAARLRPDWAEPLNAQAWLLATSHDDRLRDGAEAIRLAEKAVQLTGNRQPATLHTLAAAYAEGRRFDEAIATANKALELARQAGQGNLASAIQEALRSYEAHQPYRPKRQNN